MYGKYAVDNLIFCKEKAAWKGGKTHNLYYVVNVTVKRLKLTILYYILYINSSKNARVLEEYRF